MVLVLLVAGTELVENEREIDLTPITIVKSIKHRVKVGDPIQAAW